MAAKLTKSSEDDLSTIACALEQSDSSVRRFTTERGTGSAIGAPGQTSPPDHPFRLACTPKLVCGGALVITERVRSIA